MIIAVRVTPRAALEAFGPATDTHFAARLNAPPVEGAANVALIALVARVFGVPKHDVTLIAGEAARLKRLYIVGNPDALAKIAISHYGAAP